MRLTGALALVAAACGAAPWVGPAGPCATDPSLDLEAPFTQVDLYEWSLDQDLVLREPSITWKPQGTLVVPISATSGAQRLVGVPAAGAVAGATTLAAVRDAPLAVLAVASPAGLGRNEAASSHASSRAVATLRRQAAPAVPLALVATTYPMRLHAETSLPGFGPLGVVVVRSSGAPPGAANGRCRAYRNETSWAVEETWDPTRAAYPYTEVSLDVEVTVPDTRTHQVVVEHPVTGPALLCAVRYGTQSSEVLDVEHKVAAQGAAVPWCPELRSVDASTGVTFTSTFRQAAQRVAVRVRVVRFPGRP